MKNSVTCEIVQDLIPLYADDVCSNSSRSFVVEHLSVCEACRKVVEDGNFNVPVSLTAEQKAWRRFKKKLTKKNILTVLVAVLCCLCVIGAAGYVLFVPEYVTDYTEGMLDAHIPIDEGIDVTINLKNYKTVETWDIYNEDGSVDIYLTVMQTLFTKIYEPEDKSDFLWRTNNGSCVDFHSSAYYPLSFGDPPVRNIWYLEMDPDDVLHMTDGISFEDYETHLLWSAQE